MSLSPCSFMTALDESFTLMVSLPVILCLTLTLSPFSRVGNPFLTVLLFPNLCISPTPILCLIPVLAIHVYVTLLCSHSHLCIPRLLAMFSDSVYKTHNPV